MWGQNDEDLYKDVNDPEWKRLMEMKRKCETAIVALEEICSLPGEIAICEARTLSDLRHHQRALERWQQHFARKAKERNILVREQLGMPPLD